MTCTQEQVPVRESFRECGGRTPSQTRDGLFASCYVSPLFSKVLKQLHPSGSGTLVPASALHERKRENMLHTVPRSGSDEHF